MQVLPYLGKEFTEAQKDFGPQVAHQLGECLIALPASTERTAARALDVAASFDDPLFAGKSQLNPFDHQQHCTSMSVLDLDACFWRKVIWQLHAVSCLESSSRPVDHVQK